MRNNLKDFLKEKFYTFIRRISSERRKKSRFKLNSKNVICYGFEPQTDLIGFYGGPEYEEFLASLDYLKKNNHEFDIALDIGANIGIASLYLSSEYKKIYAFEPNPISFKILSLNAELSTKKI